MEGAKAFFPYRRSQWLSWLIAVWHSLELTRSSQDRRLNPANGFGCTAQTLPADWRVTSSFAVAVVFTHSLTVALALLSVTYGAITLQQPIMFAVCLDIGGFYTDAMVGAMNMASHSVGFWAHWYSDTSWPAPAATM